MRQVITRRTVVPIWLVLLGLGFIVLLTGLMFVNAHPPTSVQTCSSLSLTTDKENYYTGENISVHVQFDPALHDCTGSSYPSNLNTQHTVVVDANGAVISSWTTNTTVDRTVSWNPGQLTVGREFTLRACASGAQYGWEDCASKNVIVGTSWAVQPNNLLVGAGTISIGVLVVATTITALTLGRVSHSLKVPMRKIAQESERPKT